MVHIIEQMIAKGNHSCEKIKKSFTFILPFAPPHGGCYGRKAAKSAFSLDFAPPLWYPAAETGYGPKGITTVLKKRSRYLFFYAKA